MSLTLAFDVYGTLIDPYGVVAKLRSLVGNNAPAIAACWREKQLEYTFRRAAMGAYEDFVVCTRQALNYACEASDVSLSEKQKTELMAEYRVLPPYSEVRSALADLKSSGHRLYAFSNGHPKDLRTLMAHAALADCLDGIVSVHEIRSFKPDPAVYHHFLSTTGATESSCWLVSGNAFDILGAQSAGWHTAWVKRDPKAVFDPWGAEPDAIVGDLAELTTIGPLQAL